MLSHAPVPRPGWHVLCQDTEAEELLPTRSPQVLSSSQTGRVIPRSSPLPGGRSGQVGGRRCAHLPLRAPCPRPGPGAGRGRWRGVPLPRKGDLLSVSVCPGISRAILPVLPLSLCSVSEPMSMLTSVRRPCHLWCPHGLAAGMCVQDLSAASLLIPAASGEKAHVVPIWLPIQLFPVPQHRAADAGGEVSQELGTCLSSSHECLQGYFCPRHYPSGFGG